MKPARGARARTPSRPADARTAAAAVVMGRGDPARKLEKFKQPRSAARKKPVQGKAPAQRIKPALASGSVQPRSQRRSTPRASVGTVGGATLRLLLRRAERWLADTKLALESPHSNTLEALGARGSLRDALGYVGLSAVLTGVLALRTGWLGALVTAGLGVVAFAVFVYVAHFAALRQGGSGKRGDLAYASALYWAPLAPFTAVVPLIFGAAWIPAAVLVQVLMATLYMQRVLNGTLWLSYSQQWNALSAGIAASILGVLLLAFTVLPRLLRL